MVTNNHVVSGTREIAIRFATGEGVGASIAGTAPNDAVVKGQNPRNLPSPIAEPQPAKSHSQLRAADLQPT